MMMSGVPGGTRVDYPPGESIPGLLVSDRCGSLTYEFDSDNEDYAGNSDADDHCLDALRYALMGIASR